MVKLYDILPYLSILFFTCFIIIIIWKYTKIAELTAKKYLKINEKCDIIKLTAVNVNNKLMKRGTYNMDIKGKIGEIVNKVKNDKNFAENFKSDPVKAVESIIGVDLPDDQINSVVEGVKAKIEVGGIMDKVTGLFK